MLKNLTLICFFLFIVFPLSLEQTTQWTAVLFSSTEVKSTVSPNTTESNNVTASETTTKAALKPPSNSIIYKTACPDNVACDNLGASCMVCKMNHYCQYGKVFTAECVAMAHVNCTGSRSFKRPYECRYGYQLSREQYRCNMHEATSCSMKTAPPETFYAECSVNDEVLCLGNRTFVKKFPCNWTRGFKWSTALVLSVTLGGFGVDRFYLGMWKEGIGKLFSFGGLGVWTIVDVILIAVGYVGPIDSSLYMYPWDM